MSYTEEKKRINSLIAVDGKIIQLNEEHSNAKQHYYDLKRFDNNRRLRIRYPGYKTQKDKCDYCVYLVDDGKECAISHEEIMKDLYNKTTRENYSNIKKYIEDVAIVGEENISEISYSGIDFNLGFTFDELTNLMFYIGIQEDINYPKKHLEGRKMCFYRYIEAIYCKIHTNHSLADAIKRANVNYKPSKWDDVGNLYNNISNIRR